MFNGISAAYDTGTGTAPEFRGKGIAAEIFRHSLPYLREAGVRQYLLEVLQNNAKAISVYSKMNFRTTGEFICFRQSIENIRKVEPGAADYTIRPVEIDFIRRVQGFCDFAPSWQNSIESIERGADGLLFLGAVVGEAPVGYCVIDPNTGDIAQIAVKKEYRRRGIASQLLDKAIGYMKTDFVKVINVRDEAPAMQSFLESRNILPASRQFEMILSL